MSNPTHPHARLTKVRSRLLLVLGAGAIAVSSLTGTALASAAPSVAHNPGPATSSGGGSFPVTISTQYGPVKVKSRPDRIISLSPTATEMLFAIGAGHQVIAVDNDSDYPKDAPRTNLSGYTPNVEAIAKYRPDLVVISYNPTQPNLVASLRLLGIPTLYQGAADNLAQTYGEIADLGKVTGDVSSAQHEIASMRQQIASIVAATPHRAHPLTYFYEIGSSPLYTATGDTFVGSVLGLVGLKNIAGASVGGDDYPSLSSEVVVKDNPSLVFITDDTPVRAVDARSGWSAMTAVRLHRVFELNADIASRWGPRVVELLRDVVAAMAKIPVGAS